MDGSLVHGSSMGDSETYADAELDAVDEGTM